MNSREWMQQSGKGLLKPRSKALKRVDAALQAYEAAPSHARLTALSDAIDDWTATKDDWHESIRASAVDSLVLWVRRQQGVAVSVSAANYARRRMISRREWQVAIHGSQTLHYPSPGYDAYCNQWFGGNHDVDFPINVNFGITRYGTAFVVTVRALAEFQAGASRHVPADDILSHWKTHCESTWNCGVIYVGTRKYDLRFDLKWVKPGAAGPYYEVKIHQPPPPAVAPAPGPRTQQERMAAAKTARAGTPHLGQWGADDRQAIAHEFGHMIGNPDEYFCTAFSGLAGAWSAETYNLTPFTTPSIMNNTAENGCRIYERHFGLVVQEITRYLESTDPRPLPRIRAAIEKPAGVPSETAFVLSQAMHRRRAAMGYDD